MIDTDGQEEFERSFITGHRWWTLDELRKTTDDVRPHTLVDLLDRLVRGDIPDRPIRLPRADADGSGPVGYAIDPERGSVGRQCAFGLVREQGGAEGAVGGGVEDGGGGA